MFAAQRRNFHSSSVSSKKNGQQMDERLISIGIILLIFLGLIILRLLNLQVFNYEIYAAFASKQHEIYRQIVPKRGTIYFQDSKEKGTNKLYPVALNKEVYLIFAIPKNITDPVDAAYRLAKVLAIEDKNEIQILINRLSKKDDPYEVVKRNVSEDELRRVEALGIEGVQSVPQEKRFYPEKNAGAQVLGFLGFNGKEQQIGSYGIEGYFNKELAGKRGFLESEVDLYGRWIAIAAKNFKKAEDGHSIILTIERILEFAICDKLNKAVKKHGADGGSVIVADPQTGRIIAMCSAPDFDLNEYNKVKNINVYNNQGIFAAYEPGSIFKPITLSIAMDLEKITPDSTYIDEGFVRIADFKIKNSDYAQKGARGEQTMTQVLEKSLNTGAIYAAEMAGKEEFRKYLKKFGFGRPTDIKLFTEVAGDISSLDKKGDIYLATASFGQGIMATPIQMLQAYSIIANQGKLQKLYIVEEIVDANGNSVKTMPQDRGQVISKRTATLMSAMLVSVVNNGHAQRAQVKNYYIAGKTGTAQVSGGSSGYSDKTIHSFVGFGPVSNPRFVMIVRLDDPKDVRFAASSAAPLFGEIAEFILNYYEAPPDAL